MTSVSPRQEGEGFEAGMLDKRLDEIEQALKFDPDPEYRRELIREFLDLTEPKKDAAA